MREKCDYDVKWDFLPFEICENVLCACGLLHCKASHFYLHLCRNPNRVRIVEDAAQHNLTDSRVIVA